MGSKIVSTLIPFVLVIAASGCKGDSYDVYYFHDVTGVVSVRGDVNQDFTPFDGSVPYGAASYQKHPPSVHFDFPLKDGHFMASARNVHASDQESPIESESVQLNIGSVEYDCRFTCDPCSVRFSHLSNDTLVGTFTCENLSACNPASDECQPGSGPDLDVSGSFNLSDATKGARDY